MEELLAKHLLKEIPGVNQVDRDGIVFVVLGQSTHHSVDELASSLVDSGAEIGPLIASIVHCQWLIVQNLMNKNDLEHIHARLRSFSLCIERSAVLQEAVVNAFEKHCHIALQQETTGRVIAECKSQWVQEGIVHLHNYFYEMPVSAKAKFIDSSGASLVVTASEEVGRVFSASGDMRDAWIRASDDEHVLQVSVVNCRNMVLTLVMRSVDKCLRELRRDVRIQPEDSIQVELRNHKGPLTGMMHDLSFTGLGMVFNGSAELTPGESVGCVFHLDDAKLFIESAVRWIGSRDGDASAGVQFTSPGPFGDQLRRFILGQQQLHIKRLKQLSAPGWMRK